MANKKLIINILGLLYIVLFCGCKPPNLETTVPEQAPIDLGYCPTMSSYIQSLVDSGNLVSAVQYDNSSQAIQALNAGEVQAALIGRTARDHEIKEGVHLARIKDGFTLIAQTQAGIPYEALPLVRIMTLDKNQDAADILPPDTSIVYYEEFDCMLADLDGVSAVMLRWSELPASYQLLIPFDAQGNKIPEFRSPHLYYDKTLALDFSQIIGALSSQE